MNISKAINSINPNAEFSILENDINKITWLNGTAVISKSDIQAKMIIVEAEEATAITTAKNNKTSATNKLKALGLTDAEIEAL